MDRVRGGDDVAASRRGLGDGLLDALAHLLGTPEDEEEATVDVAEQAGLLPELLLHLTDVHALGLDRVNAVEARRQQGRYQLRQVAVGVLDDLSAVLVDSVADLLVVGTDELVVVSRAHEGCGVVGEIPLAGDEVSAPLECAIDHLEAVVGHQTRQVVDQIGVEHIVHQELLHGAAQGPGKLEGGGHVIGDGFLGEGRAKHVEHEEVGVSGRAHREALEVGPILDGTIDGIGLAEVAQVIDHAESVADVLLVHPLARSQGNRGHAVQVELAHEGDQCSQDLCALHIVHVHHQLGLGEVLGLDEVLGDPDDRGFVVGHLPDGNAVGLLHLQRRGDPLLSIHQ